MDCSLLAALLITNASALGVTLEVSVERPRVRPGAFQTVTVGGLAPGERFRAAWLDPTGRVRGSWEARAGRGAGGERLIRFRVRRAIPGRHRVVAWLAEPDGGRGGKDGSGAEAEAPFLVLPGRRPAYLATLDAPGLAPGLAEETGARAGFHCLALAGLALHDPLDRGPPDSHNTSGVREGLGALVRVFEGGPPFLGLDRLDEERLRAARAAYEKAADDASGSDAASSDRLLSRPVCLRDDSWPVEVWRRAGPRAERARLLGPWLWSMGSGARLAEEGGGLDFCRSPQCLPAFMRSLQDAYGGMDSLNLRWGRDFLVWGEVRPPTTRELVRELGGGPETDGANARGTVAAWSDHRTFMDRTWTGALDFARDLVTSADRGARVGLEDVSLPGVFTGEDPVRLLAALDWVEIRPRPLDMALARGIAPSRPRRPLRPSGPGGAGTRRGCRVLTRLEAGASFAGADAAGRGEAEALRRALWRGFVNGHAGAILHVGDASGDAAVAAVAPALRAVNAGPGELFARSEWEPDPVCVLYSHRSVQVEWAMRSAGAVLSRKAGGTGRAAGTPGSVPGRTEAAASTASPSSDPGMADRRAGKALAAWAELLSDIGIAARFIDSAEVARGALRPSRAPGWRRVRALVLPRAYVLTREEVSEIARFARAGGLVVADACAGVFDESFDDARRPEIEGLFGVARRAGPQAPISRRPPPGLSEVALAGMRVPGAYIDGVGSSHVRLAERGVSATTGVALARSADGGSGLFTNAHGEGKAVYLNAVFEDYLDDRTAPAGASLRRLVRNVLEVAQVRPRVEVLTRGPPPAGGRPVPGVERLFRRLEEAVVVSVSRDPAFGTEPVDAELVFRTPAYCYDLLDGVLIGTSKRVNVRLSAGARIFARLPYDVEDITINTVEREGVVRYRAVIETSTGMAGTHLVRQELTADLFGEGEIAVPGSSKVVVAGRGVVKGRVALARNEPGGTYRLVLRDVMTGVESDVAFAFERSPLRERFPLPPAGLSGPERAPGRRGTGKARLTPEAESGK